MGVPSNHPEVINDHFKIFVLKPIVTWGFPHDFHGQVLDFFHACLCSPQRLDFVVNV
jgi:hypothetical protein